MPPAPIIAGMVISAVGSLAAGALSFAQAQSQAKAVKAQAAFNKQISEQNAVTAKDIAARNATAERQKAHVDEVRLRRDQRRRMAQAEVTFGISGTAFQGSVLDVMADQAMEAELNAQLVRFGGEQRAKDHLFQGEVNARNEMIRGMGAEIQGNIQASQIQAQGTGSLLSGAFGAGTAITGGLTTDLFLSG